MNHVPVTMEFANNRGLPREAWIEFVPETYLVPPGGKLIIELMYQEGQRDPIGIEETDESTVFYIGFDFQARVIHEGKEICNSSNCWEVAHRRSKPSRLRTQLRAVGRMMASLRFGRK